MEKFSWFKDENSRKEAGKIVQNLNISQNQEDNYADTNRRQTFSLEEEREFRELIPKYESSIEKLDELETKSVEYRNKQNQDFIDLNLELVDLNEIISSYLAILRHREEKKEKITHLNKKNLEFHINQNDINLPITNEEKEIKTLEQEVSELEKIIINENILTKLPILKKQSAEIEKKINSLRDLWYPAKPIDN
ncbi:MAG: hypothetical protein WC011_03410 [Candidatus Paceibacterota bacterium]